MARVIVGGAIALAVGLGLVRCQVEVKPVQPSGSPPPAYTQTYAVQVGP